MKKKTEMLAKQLIETIALLLQGEEETRINRVQIKLVQEKDHWDIKFNYDETPNKK